MPLSLTDIMELLLLYKYLFLFLIVMLEGPIATIIAGFVISVGQMNFWISYLVILAADTAGDAFYYAVGYYGRTAFIEKWGKYVGLHTDRIERLERHFGKHTGKTLIIGKVSHGIGGAVLVAAGIARVHLGRYLFYNCLASIPKSLVLLIVGYYFGQAYAQIDHYFTYAAIGMFGIAIFTTLLYTGIHRLGKEYES